MPINKELASEDRLPPIPTKRYFSIGEVSKLANIKPHVLCYWEHEFAQLRQIKRRGYRHYYQHHEVLLIRRIRTLLYDDGFTIQGARQRLATDGTVIKSITAQEVRQELESILKWLDEAIIASETNLPALVSSF